MDLRPHLHPLHNLSTLPALEHLAEHSECHSNCHLVVTVSLRKSGSIVGNSYLIKPSPILLRLKLTNLYSTKFHKVLELMCATSPPPHNRYCCFFSP